MHYIDHSQLRLEIGSATTDLKHLQITRGINQHTQIIFRISVPPEKKGEYAKHLLLLQTVKVLHTTEQGDNILCQGVITDCDLEKNRDEYTLSATALSFSYYLDIIRRSRSFQDVNQTEQDFFRHILTMDAQTAKEQLDSDTDLQQALLAAYNRTYFIDYAIDPHGATPKQKFDIQFQETDWTMLIRKCSEYSVGILVDDTKDSPQLSIGLPDDLPVEHLPEDKYIMHRNLAYGKHAMGSNTPDLSEANPIAYLVDSDKLLTIGQPVHFLDCSLYVASIKSILDTSGALINQYLLTVKDGLKILTCHNPLLTGRSLDGQVIAIEHDKIKVHISIDREQDLAAAYWMPYSTMYSSGQSSGWYVMPEKNDQVRVYFPNDKEAECVAISSVSKQTPQSVAAGASGDAYAMDRDRMADPSVKSFMTAYGKEIILAPNCICIQGKGVSVILSDNGGIEINTDKSISLRAAKNLLFNADNIIVDANQHIVMKCAGSSLAMAADKCVIHGPKVKIN